MENQIKSSSAAKSTLGRKHQLKRLVWNLVWGILARPIPRTLLNSWKIFLLRLFGAKIHKTALVYSSAKIYAPWLLEMDAQSCIANEVDCYNVGTIKIGKMAVISQKSYLCAASHDITDANNPLLIKPIIIEDQAWVAADAFIGPGVTIGQGAVVGARSSVFKNVDPWTVVGGNPSKFIKNRVIKN